MSQVNLSLALIKKEMGRKQSGGFTFIEVFLVIGIILIIAVAASPIYTGLQITSQLNENTTSIIQTIRIARERSAAGFNNASHGVYFEINAEGNDKYILYQGATFVTRDSTQDRVAVLDSALSLFTTLPSSDINFLKRLGIPNAVGIVTLTHDVSGTRTINLNELGKVEEN